MIKFLTWWCFPWRNISERTSRVTLLKVLRGWAPCNRP